MRRYVSATQKNMENLMINVNDYEFIKRKFGSVCVIKKQENFDLQDYQIKIGDVVSLQQKQTRVNVRINSYNRHKNLYEGKLINSCEGLPINQDITFSEENILAVKKY